MEDLLKRKNWLAMKYKRIMVFVFLVVLAMLELWHVFGMLFVFVGMGIVGWYCIMNWTALRITRFQDWINPLKWASVLYASFMKLMFPVHIVEQLILRMYDMECRKCVANGSCLYCGCDISKVYTPWDKCSEGNWGEMIEDKEEYRKLREEWPVEIRVRYLREI